MCRKAVQGWFVFGLTGVVLGVSAGESAGQVPWQNVVNFRRVDADPNSDYPLTADHGPWMILAITFSGTEAHDQARALVHELRRSHKLEAYTHEKVFDYSESIPGRGFDRHGNIKRMRHQRDDRVREVAVLVGHFDSVDHPGVERTLERIKSMHPETLAALNPPREAENPRQRTLSEFLLLQRREASRQGQRGPMGLAFVAANPLLPEGYFRPGGVDRFVAEMNEGIRHGLLENRGAYTVKVATFSGQTVVDPRDIQKIEQGGTMSSRLEEAAMNAHRMCEALRAKGYDAYQFHDRYSSIVTVGSFNSLGTQQLDGSFQYDPRIAELVHRFSAKPTFRGVAGAQSNGELLPQSIIGLPFDLEPQPIDVPRRSFGRDYAGNR